MKRRGAAVAPPRHVAAARRDGTASRPPQPRRTVCQGPLGPWPAALRAASMPPSAGLRAARSGLRSPFASKRHPHPPAAGRPPPTFPNAPACRGRSRRASAVPAPSRQPHRPRRTALASRPPAARAPRLRGIGSPDHSAAPGCARVPAGQSPARHPVGLAAPRRGSAPALPERPAAPLLHVMQFPDSPHCIAPGVSLPAAEIVAENRHWL